MLRFNLLLHLLLRRWRHRHPHRNLKNNLRFRLLINQNQFAGLQLANQNPENSSRRSRNRTGYPNLFDRLTPKR